MVTTVLTTWLRANIQDKGTLEPLYSNTLFNTSLYTMGKYVPKWLIDGGPLI